MVSITVSIISISVSSLIVDGVTVAQTYNANAQSYGVMSAIVPPGSTYRYTGLNNLVVIWAELR